MNDLCAILGHSPGMFGICNVCGVQTYVMPSPVKRLTLEEAKEKWPDPLAPPTVTGEQP